MTEATKPADETCSFCGKPFSEAYLIITGNNAAICDSCVTVAIEVILKRIDSRQKTESIVSGEKSE